MMAGKEQASLNQIVCPGRCDDTSVTVTSSVFVTNIICTGSFSIHLFTTMVKTTGSILQLVHWGPIITLFIIFLISFSGLVCDLMWWPPLQSFYGFLHFLVYINWIFIILYNYFRAALLGPGFVRRGWKPENEDGISKIQYCIICKTYKAPRSHHCRKCDRCVMKMDHHCPWINTCCGHKNHANFTWFLFYAPFGCIHAAIVLSASLYRAINMYYYIYYGDGTEPLVHLTVAGFITVLFSIGLAIGVVIAVWALFFIQFKSIWKNETGIETWICDKALSRERTEDEDEVFIYPYNLGWRENLRQAFVVYDQVDGYTWPVVEGCDQYTLTMAPPALPQLEQIHQKKLKKWRMLQYSVIESYNGAMIPFCRGVRICYDVPCTDEPRIPVKKGDQILVSRRKRHWLYGDKLLSKEEKEDVQRLRGWFPRYCAVEAFTNGDVSAEAEEEEKIQDKKND